jgi:8-oxo-dGTP pyrophosphatase MutT (NUDIX family)
MSNAREPFRADRPGVPELAAGAVVVHEPSGEVLLIHHRKEDRWCLPKGHVEPGESVLEGARREVVEETGLDTVRLGPEVSTVHYRFYSGAKRANVFKTAVYFLGTSARREVRLEPLFDAFRWVPPEEALRLVPFDTDREAIRSAVRAVGAARAAG